MKTLKKVRFVSLMLTLILVVMMAVPTRTMAAEPTVNLGSTASFAVLAGETITNTGPTTINGDVGLFPGTAFTGQASATVNGTVHINDAVAGVAKDDLVTAYDDAAGRTPVTIIPTELGGATLNPGVYASESGTFQITGTLTLDAQGDPDGVFIFKTDSTLITASASNVDLINGARFCRVFWKVGSSATLGTNSHFAGHIFALTSIAAQTGATIQGQLLARNGEVTLDTNTITNGLCAAQTVPGIQITKTASPTALTSGPGSVTYTYRVTNPGTNPLSDVVVTDNKLSPVTYASGDANTDGLLQSGETWVYTGTTRLTATTTNIATAMAMSGETAITDTASVRVAVSTVTGGQIPKTATPWYNALVAGIALMLLGAMGYWRTTRRIHA
ncbi:MAG: ice-binding family protein [Actinomycetia bacterium]|nr:ice-binding family protein [Actinomycetes bacterium]